MKTGQVNITQSKSVRIFTLGWSPEFVIRPLTEEGVEEGDVIVLIASRPETDYAKKRVEEAYRQVGTFLQMVGVPSLHYREVEIDKDILSICRDIIKIVKEFNSTNLFKFYLTGGMRVLVIATMIAAKILCQAGKHVEVKLSREDRPVSYTVPIKLLELNVGDVTEAQLEVLRYLKARGEARFEDLAIGRSEVTVRKHLTRLRESGLVSYTVKGRKQFYKLTPLGEMVLEVIG